MGIILKDKMEDFTASRSEFNRLLSRYPDNIYRLDTYYNMYIMAVRDNNIAEANKYRDLILEQFPESGYGIAMRDPNYFDNLKMMNTHQETLYANTYDDYLNNRNQEVHDAYKYMTEKFPLSRIMPKFMFLHALAFVTENDSEQFNATLKELLEKYPDTDITPVASAYLKQMAQGRKLENTSSNLRGMIWSTRLSNDSTANANADKPAEFTINESEAQLLVLLFPTDKVSANQLLYEVARHNFTSFTIKDFDLELMNFEQLGLIIIKGCNNVVELKEYRKIMNESTDFNLPQHVRPVEISVSNFDLLIKEGRSFEEYFNFIGEEDYKATEEKVLPPEEFGISEGIPTPEPIIESIDSVPSEEQEVKPLINNANAKNIQLLQKEKDIETPTSQNKPEQPKPEQKQQNKPKEPAYTTGSEGDDPLFDMP